MIMYSVKPMICLKQILGPEFRTLHCQSCLHSKLLIFVSSQKTGSHLSRTIAPFSTSHIFLLNHYEVLGVERSASMREIKDAYLKLSKELHPDKHQGFGTDSNSNDEQKNVHDKFVAVNAAYGVLGKPDSKRIYDLGLARKWINENRSENGRKRMVYYEYRNVEDRARAMGYNVDPDYFKKHKNSKVIVAGCILLIFVGFFIQYFAAHRRKEQWERRAKEFSDREKYRVENKKSTEEHLDQLRQMHDQRLAKEEHLRAVYGKKE